MNTDQKNTTHLVIGLGEVGKALKEVLACDGRDARTPRKLKAHYDVLHICFPWGSQFIVTVKKYQQVYRPQLTIIHSSVPVGTTRQIPHAVHSPIRGIHPHLADGIRTFVKFFGGEHAEEAAAFFSARGIKTRTTKKAENTEAGKLWDTTQYAAFILLEKEIYEYCKKHSLDFEVVYTLFNQTYNEGYSALGREEVMRPFLQHTEGPIGGHCIEPNARMLESEAAHHVVRFQEDQREKHKKQKQ